jgi:perosamine synthetase
MFTLKETWGQHSIYKYDVTTHPFIIFFKKLYNTESLETIGLNSEDNKKNDIQDKETLLHKQFYTKIKNDNEFKKLYCQFIKDIYSFFFPEENVMIYQAFPSIRIQFQDNVVVPPHYDSDHIGMHPIGEKNFLLPLTRMTKSTRLFIESEPGKKDFQGIELEEGELLFFNGNTCTHYNEKNVEDFIRVSLDFRVITLKDYINYINSNNITITNPRDPEKTRIPVKMVIGGYYQMHYTRDKLEKMLDWTYCKDLMLQSRPNFDINEANACYEYMKTGENFVTEYKKTEELEKMICELTGSKHCIMTTSGNMAIILALMALDIKDGDEVIVPNYTMIATINSVKMLGAKPIITDVDEETYTISLDIIKKHVTSKTKAVIHVSLNNRSKNICDIKDYCEQNNIYLVEDAAQSLGCKTNGIHYGRYGIVGCFSLSTPKIISTGQGGFVITDNDIIAKKMSMIKNFGRKTGGIDDFETFGINMKFTDIQAVIGIEQMKKLNNRVIRMKEIYSLYYNELNNFCKMIKPSEETWIPWFVDIYHPKRDHIMKFLKIHNIQTRVTYPEINKTNMYYDIIIHPVSNYISNNGLFLPTHTILKDNEIIHICKLIKLALYS